MAEFRRDSKPRSSGRRESGGSGRFERRDSERSSGRREFSRPAERREFSRNSGGGFDREMFKTTCANCGNECRVPFKPTGSKPVYCNDCFKNADSMGTTGGSSNSSSISQEDLNNINKKLDKILAALHINK